MEQLIEVPTGTPCVQPRGNDRLRPDGWRKATASQARGDALAADGQGRALPRTRAIVALKRVAAQIGLKAADLLLLDTLMAFSQPQDWEAGACPIVWPSNAFLMAQTGFSLSTLKRHARKLGDAGLIAFRDSPNGKRWGHRAPDGRIVEAYGFDLSPLAVRAPEFEALAEKLAKERAMCQRLKRQITIARRSIRARLEAQAAAGQGQDALWDSFHALLARLGAKTLHALSALAQAFSDLLDRVSPEAPAKVTPMEPGSDPHTQTTNQLQSVSETHDRPETQDRAGKDITLPVILQTCPEFTLSAKHLGLDIRSWTDLCRAASDLRPMLGIAQRAWTAAIERLGPVSAATALALVFEKTASGQVTSPGGYLSGMLRKARVGELHLDRSFYGRLRALP